MCKHLFGVAISETTFLCARHRSSHSGYEDDIRRVLLQDVGKTAFKHLVSWFDSIRSIVV